MRPCIVTAAFAITLVACGGRFQQIESAGEKLKQAVNQCSFSVTPSDNNKPAEGKVLTGVKTENVTDVQQNCGDRIQTIWNSRLKLW